MVIRYLRSGPPRQNTEPVFKNIRRCPGQVQYVMGLFTFLFIMLFMMFELQLASYSTTSDYLEDALTASGLASALIDVREYGETRVLKITDVERAYSVYNETLAVNLGLDNGKAKNSALISGDVKIEKYCIYNVEGNAVTEISVGAGGAISTRTGMLGSIKAPNGQLIEKTGVFSEISFPVKGFLGVVTTAKKAKLVEVNGA